ncbi:MAG: RICIN domain-containing protein [Polyangiaceae bacterium]
MARIRGAVLITTGLVLAGCAADVGDGETTGSSAEAITYVAPEFHPFYNGSNVDLNDTAFGTSGAIVAGATNTGGANQQWSWDVTSGVQGHIRGYWNNCVAWPSSIPGNMTMHACDGSTNTLWSRLPISGTLDYQYCIAGQPDFCIVDAGLFGWEVDDLNQGHPEVEFGSTILNTWFYNELRTLGNRCLDVASFGTGNGTKVQTWDCNGYANQDWTYNTSTHEINGYGGNCLDVSGFGTANGTIVQMWSCSGGSNQKWSIGAEGQVISYNGTGRCLDITSYSVANGAQAQIWDCTNGMNQEFYFKY